MNDLGWGLEITALGMGLVFGLLALLWGLLTLVLRLDAPAAPEPEAVPAAAPAIDPAIVAAITVAVRVHAIRGRTGVAPQTRLHGPGSLLHASRWVAAGRTRQNDSWQRRR
jgi:glutaconyl-CoA/methylmalonyl-CoA decarboxylase subunit delta